MKRIEKPSLLYTHVLDKCKEGIKYKKDIDEFSGAEEELIFRAEEYVTLGENGQLFTISSIQLLADNVIVVSPLTKKTLIRLYEYYLLNKDKPGRKIYDKLLASTNEKCPMCGDIGRPRNLDHFLPKAHFPQFSIFPLNLIPCCRDCNMDGKGAAYAESEDTQIIHPYIDKDIFFSQQWIFSHYIDGDLGIIEYFVSPPIDWLEFDKKRVIKHFEEFDLANRYQIESSKHISEVIDQGKSLVHNLTQISPDLPREVIIDFFKSSILAPIINGPLFHNHWKKVMYSSLSEDDNFLNHIFI